jgi:hypothetical protein
MSDTPETDAVAEYEGNWDTKALRMTEFARKLERERDEARFDLAFRRELYAFQELQLSEARKTILELQKP